MTSEEKRELLLCISMRICVIETGDPVLRASDVHARLRVAVSDHERKQWSRMLRPLPSDTMKLILMLEDLYGRIEATRTTVFSIKT